MSCDQFEMNCETDDGPGSIREAELRRHAAACEECAGLLATFDALKGAGVAFAVPEPHPSYWVRFNDRLHAKLASGRWSAALSAPSLPARLALAFGSMAILALSIVALRTEAPSRQADLAPARSSATGLPTAKMGAAGSALPEDELLARLEEASKERLDETLDAVFPIDPLTAPGELAAAAGSLPQENTPTGGSDSPYDLLLDLGEEERNHLLKEIQSEIG